MPPFEQQEIPFQGHRLRNARFRRGIYLLPSLFTAGNLLCGYYAIMASIAGGSENFDRAAIMIGVAIVFDSLDGHVARLTGTSSAFGVQFDSLADVVSFGVAPAILAYSWGVHGLPEQDTTFVQQISQWGWICCLMFLICCAWRLARFNVQGMAPGSSKYFVGMPTPAAAALIASIVHGFKMPIQNPRWAVLWILVPACLGALMTSAIRFYSFKDVPWLRRQRSLAIILMVLLLAAILRYSEFILVILASSYAIAGVVLHVLRMLRHRAAARIA